jgi:hypothetical protein
MSLWLFCFWALLGVLFVTQALIRGKASALNQPVRLGFFEHPVRWFVAALSWWHRLVALAILVAVGYGCFVDSTTRLIVAITVTTMVIVSAVWRRRHGRDPGAAV